MVNRQEYYKKSKTYIESCGFELLSKEIKAFNDSIHIKCSEGHETEVKLHKFKKLDEKCKICKKNKLNIIRDNEFKNLLKENRYLFISGEYQTRRSKYEVICPEGHCWQVCLEDFKQGNRCPICRKEENRLKLLTDENIIYDMFTKEGYEPLSGFDGMNRKMIVKCPKGHITEKTPKGFKRGTRCFECFGAKKYTLEEAKQIFRDQGFIPLFEQYSNNNESLPFLCPKHEEYGVQYARLNNMKKGLANCRKCYLLLFTGKNSPQWKGGVSAINNYLRSSIYDDWTFPSLKKFDFKCALSFTKSHLEIHHINKNFSEIVEECFKNTSVDLRSTIGEFSSNELEVLKKECIKLHLKYGLGIPLHKDIHRLFHSLYGKKNNTINQFKEFQIRWSNGEFETLINFKEENRNGN